MHASPSGTRTIKPAAAVVCAVVFMCLAMVLPAEASATLTITPPKPVAGDAVTAHGFSRECYGGTAAPTYTFTFTLHNSNGSSTVVSSGPGTFVGAPGGGNQQYRATLSQAGNYTVD